jgi:hypothetical protein
MCRFGSKHLITYALGKNPMNGVKDNEDYLKEIQDIKLTHELGVPTHIARRSMFNTTTSTMFMVKDFENMQLKTLLKNKKK